MVAGGAKIVEALSRDPNGLAQVLCAKGLISDSIYQDTIELKETRINKARRLYSAVLKLVQEYPQQYDDFIGMFREKRSQYNAALSFLENLQVSNCKSVSS